MTDEKLRIVLWKVAMGLGRIEADPQNTLHDLFFVGDEEISELWYSPPNLIMYDWEIEQVVLTAKGKKLL